MNCFHGVVASDTVEDYIKQIFLEQERTQDKYVPMGRISETLNVSPGTVTTMIKGIAEDGLLDYVPRKGAALTEKGRLLALHMVRKHRLVEVFLVQTLGLDWSEVHIEAERIEHALSEKVLDKLDAFLGHPTCDPHGAPIPTAHGAYPDSNLHNLTECPIDETLVLARIGSKGPEFLQFAHKEGLKPGIKLKVTYKDEVTDRLKIQLGNKKELQISFMIARMLMAETV